MDVAPPWMLLTHLLKLVGKQILWGAVIWITAGSLFLGEIFGLILLDLIENLFGEAVTEIIRSAVREIAEVAEKAAGLLKSFWDWLKELVKKVLPEATPEQEAPKEAPKESSEPKKPSESKEPSEPKKPLESKDLDFE